MSFIEFLLSLTKSNSKSNDLKVGDWVHIISYGCDGQIIGIIGDEYEVDVDEHDDGSGTVDVFERSDLEKM